MCEPWFVHVWSHIQTICMCEPWFVCVRMVCMCDDRMVCMCGNGLDV